MPMPTLTLKPKQTHSVVTTVRRGDIWILLGLSLLCVSKEARLAFALSLPSLHTDISPSSNSPFCTSCCDRNRRGWEPLYSAASDNDDTDELSASESSISESLRRRRILQTLTCVATTALIGDPSAANAGEVGARITKAVTTSDLGISVRTSVVKGAQLADKIDGQWEKFSDKFGLGSERSKQVGRRPKDKVIPDPLPLNIDAAQKILDVSDEVFLKLMPSLSPQMLTSRIEKIARSAMPSFIRSGVVFAVNKDGNGNTNFENLGAADFLRFETAPQFNFVVYSHFKAYSELILERGNSINFSNFRTEYERGVGQRLIETLRLVDTTSKESAGQERQTNANLKSQLLSALGRTDNLGRRLRELGLVANVDRNNIESNDDLQDFVDDALAELIVTVSVDGDVTLQSQILLQEQGYRLYPNFNRFVVAEFFREAIQTQSTSLPSNVSANDDGGYKVSVIDYYFDTNYNSDPDKFEVKQVLLNVSIQ